MDSGIVMEQNGINGHEFESNGAAPTATAVETTTASATGVVQMDYTTDFPGLPSAKAAAPKVSAPAWGARPTAVTTQVFQLSAEERQTRGKSFGGISEENKRCQYIATDTKTRIELCENKDGSLTVIVKGTKAACDLAKGRLVKDLQTQINKEISIPKDHHRKLIGKEGSALRALEAETNCRIDIPKRDAPTDVIKVTGPRDGIDRAIRHIMSVSEREAKLATEHILCPREYYPWVRGPSNEIVDQLVAETGVKINIPPSTADNEIIVITGEKDGVHKAALHIRGVLAAKQGVVKSLSIQISRAQHRYIIGKARSGIADILRTTDVAVEVPNEEEKSDMITLRGETAKLTDAVAMVYQRASSVITSQLKAPVWLHKYLIGPKGARLGELCPNRNKVQIDFEDSGAIFLEGAPEEVRTAQAALQAEVDKLEKENCMEKVKVAPTLHRHVIGRGGAFISKLKDEHGVQISIPNEATNSDEITVEGKKEGVKEAIKEIRKIVTKLENEKSKDMIVEQRLHKLIIGQKGSEIQKLRDQYPSVVFSFPDANKKSDVINIRGDKQEVDKVSAVLVKVVKELQENNYQQAVPIFKEFHKHIIGKAGATVRKIREETSTRIDLPDGDSGEEKILVTGKKANVEKAIEHLNKIQNELASVVQLEVEIPTKVQARLLGNGRRLIFDIEEECGGVHIKFPSEKSDSTKVTIRGPSADAEKAHKLLSSLAKDKELDIHEDKVTAKAELHKFLIGKGGARIKKIRADHDVRVMFPRSDDADKETIHLLGKKGDVEKVKAELEALVKELNETVEIKLDINPVYHKNFLVRGAALLKEIQEQNGGVAISFPARGGESATVTIKGSKQCAESAKAKLEEMVEDFEKQTTMTVEIASQHHRVLLSNRGQKVHEIQSKYNVSIRFPGRQQEGQEVDQEAANRVVISGRDTKCELAKEELLALVPISKTVNVPYDAHRFIIGKGGETIRKIMQDNDVNISVPKDEQIDEIVVSGTVEAVEAAEKDIAAKMEEYEAQAEDRKLRQFELVIDVPADYHQKIIGPKGATVNALRAKHDVQISLPRGENKCDQITLHGYEAAARACAAEIEEMIGELKAMFTTEFELDARYHPRLIGQRGRNLRKVQEDYGVEIRLPRGEQDPNTVSISGKSEEAVYDCIDFLRDEEEEFLADFNDRNQYMSVRAPAPQQAAPARGVQISGAPWQLDIGSSEQFPDMGGATSSQVVGGAWGAARRF